MLLFIFVSVAALPVAATDFEWRTSTPESQGMSSERLDALKDTLAARNTTNFLVIRNDTIVYEWYAPGRSAKDLHYTASLAKALVAGMSLAVVISDGQMKLDDTVATYVPQWKSDARKAKITIRQLGSHTSGLDNARPNAEAKWKDDFWKESAPPHDPFTISRDITPLLFEPGEKMKYSNPGIAMLNYAVTVALKDSPNKDIRTLLRDRIMRPIGVPDSEWDCGSLCRTSHVDGLPLVPGWGGGSYTPRAVARIARLVLREGDWDGKRILSRDAIRQTTTDAGLDGHCGMGWWTNVEGTLPGLPRDAIWGWGSGEELLLIVPSLKLIMVRNGGELQNAAEIAERPKIRVTVPDYHAWTSAHLFAPVVAAVTE